MLSRLRTWFLTYKNRIGIIAVGHTAKKIEEYVFDWLIYGLVVAWATSTWGAWYGSLVAFAIMGTFSAIMCWLYLLFYDWAKIDWFGFEMLKDLREREHEGLLGKVLAKMLNLGDIPAFIALSIYFDPFMVTVYMRKKGHEHKGLSSRDWKIFWASVIFSNAYWTLRWTVILTIALYIWNNILAPLFS